MTYLGIDSVRIAVTKLQKTSKISNNILKKEIWSWNMLLMSRRPLSPPICENTRVYKYVAIQGKKKVHKMNLKIVFKMD
jgi:hypothetical protein